MKRRTTLIDVAREAGVDKSTVSLILNNRPLARRLHADTRRRVQETAARLHYRPSTMARSMMSGKTATLGLVLGAVTDGVFALMNCAFINATRARGYQLVTLVTGWDPEREVAALKALYDQQTEGVFFLPHSIRRDSAFLNLVRDVRFPVLLYGDREPGFGSVHIDYREGIRAALRHLAPRHREVAHLSPAPREPEDPMGRFRSIAAAVAEFGQTETFVDLGAPDQPDEPERIYRIVRESSAKAFLIHSSANTLKAIRLLLRAGVRVPEDVELVGFAPFTWAEYCTPSLSDVSYDVESMMEAAADMLLEFPEKGPRELIVPTWFNARESTR